MASNSGNLTFGQKVEAVLAQGGTSGIMSGKKNKKLRQRMNRLVNGKPISRGNRVKQNRRHTLKNMREGGHDHTACKIFSDFSHSF